MKVSKLENGQFEVKHENLILTQTTINGEKYNDCSVYSGEYYEIVSSFDDRFKPLFIALYHFKYEI